METQRDRRTTETQQNHGDPTQSPWTGHLTTSHPQPHPIRPPILPPIRSDTLHPPPQSPHARPSIIKSHMNNSGHIITSTSRTGWPPCLPIYSQRRTHLVLAGLGPCLLQAGVSAGSIANFAHRVGGGVMRLSRRLVDDNHPVHALLFHFCILLHTSSPSSAPLALHRWLDALLRRFRDEGGGKE